MSQKVVWFVRGSDGEKISTVEGSAAYEIMLNDGGFMLTVVDAEPQPVSFMESDDAAAGANGEDETVDPGTDAKPRPVLKVMKKAQLVAYAESIGVKSVPDSMNIKQIIGVIEAKWAEDGDTTG